MDRQATVEAVSKLVCLTLDRDTFVEILGPLEQIMAREKSAQVSDGTCQGCDVQSTPDYAWQDMTKYMGIAGHHAAADEASEQGQCNAIACRVASQT